MLSVRSKCLSKREIFRTKDVYKLQRLFVFRTLFHPTLIFVGMIKQMHKTLQYYHVVIIKGKAIPTQAWTGRERSKSLRLPRFLDNRHMTVERLSALRTSRFYPPGNTPGTHL
jgi:hypothetical protein